MRGNITVIGGYHVSGIYKTDELIPFDYAIIGEGDLVVKEVMKEIIKKGKPKGNLPKVVISDQIRDLDQLAFPIRATGFLNQYKLTDLHWPPPSKQVNTALVLGSRGCKNSCNFCASSTIWGDGLRLRNPDSIINEIWQLKENFGTNNIVFVDQALGQDTSWTNSLCQKMIEERLDINWYIQTNITIDPSLIPIMAEAGCTKIGFGVEGLSARAVERVKPVHNNHMVFLNDLFTHCNTYGIVSKAYFILGFPWETPEMIQEYYDWIIQLKVNVIKISFFIPFPGTIVYEKYKNQLVTQNWDYFDLVQMPVVYNPSISVDEYKKIRKNILRTFYMCKEFRNIAADLITKYPKMIESYLEFYDFLQEQEMLEASTHIHEWLPELNNSDVMIV